MDLDNLLWYARVALHLGTFAILVRYQDPDAKYRGWVSVLAICFCAPSIALAVLGILQPQPHRFGTQYNFLFLFPTLGLFVLVAKSKGNVAKMLPRIPWSHRP